MPKTPPSSDWLKMFLEYLNVDRGVSPHTLTSYSRTLELFRKAVRKDWALVTADDIHAYSTRLFKSGVSAKTVRQRIAALRHFFRFLFFEKLLPYELTRHVNPPKTPKSVVRPVTTEEVEKMLAALGTDSPLDLRNRALLHVAFGSGLRVSEILKLRTKDVDLEHGIAKVRQGKGGKDRLTPMNPAEMQSIRDYLERSRPNLARGRIADVLFISDNAKPLTRQRIWQVFERLSLSVLGRKVSPHKHRHAFVTETMRGGADIRVVQTMVGHRHVQTTAHYLHSDFDRVRQWYFKTHPRGVMPCETPSSLSPQPLSGS